MTYVQPVLAVLLTVLVLASVVYRSSRHCKLVTCIALALLFLWAWPPFACLMAGSLEWWYPILPYPPGDGAEAIVVLSAGAYPRDSSQPEDLLNSDTETRVSYAAWLYHHWRQLPIVVSGGPTASPGPTIYLAEIMRRALEQRGVPHSMILVENRSRSTYENAVYSASLLRSKGIHKIVLVTEAHHMLRAEKCFRRQGLLVTPGACAYRYLIFHPHWTEFIPSAKAILLNEDGLHEWVGIVWYWISRKI
jgi:uncharacterized SAM-binding protein YcdF (DUF218 family)